MHKGTKKSKSINTSLTIAYIILIYLTISTNSCNDSKISDKQTNRIGEIKYATQLNWMGHYYLDEKSRYKLMKEVEREFRLRNQEIELKLVFSAQLFKDWGVENEFIASMIKSGNYQYDIIDMDPGRYNAIGRLLNDPDWGGKYLVDFTDVDWFKERHQSFMFSNKRIRQSTGNIMPSSYIEGIYGGLWVNTRLLAKIGGSLKQFGINIKDFHDLSDKVKAYNKNSSSKIALLDMEISWSSCYDSSRVLFMSAYYELTEEEGNMNAAIKALSLNNS